MPVGLPDEDSINLAAQIADLDQRDGSQGFSVWTIARLPETIKLDKTSQEEIQKNAMGKEFRCFYSGEKSHKIARSERAGRLVCTFIAGVAQP
jgi:hypothetical protein